MRRSSTDRSRRVLVLVLAVTLAACSGGSDPTGPGGGESGRPDPEDIRGRMVRTNARIDAIAGNPSGDTYALGSNGILLRRPAGT